MSVAEALQTLTDTAARWGALADEMEALQQERDALRGRVEELECKLSRQKLRAALECDAESCADATAAPALYQRVIYVAGPYTAPTHIGVERNVLAAKAAAIELLKRGWAVLCPHTMTHTCEIGTGLEPEAFYESDLALLRRCDAIFFLRGWEDSQGTVREAYEAAELGLAAYYEADGYPVPGEVAR